jgi:hypothetical protein
MTGEIDSAVQLLEKWERDFDPNRPPLEDEEPKGLLYHYTTAEGLLGILDTGSLRATHARYMNDRTELKSAFNQEFENLFLDGIFPGAPEGMKEGLRKMRAARSPDDVFIASFTDDGAALGADEHRPGDRLSQWRAYSSHTGGFSLGFDSKALLRMQGAVGLQGAETSSLFRCRYLTVEKTDAAKRIAAWGAEILPKILESRRRFFRKATDRDPSEDEQVLIEFGGASYTLGMVDGFYFAREAVRFKDRAFSEEHEWRFVVQSERQKLLGTHCSDPDSPIIHFRQGKFGVTPFINLPLQLTSEKSPLRRVVIGPLQYEEGALESVRFLLESKRIKLKTDACPGGVEVVTSGVPYRNS